MSDKTKNYMLMALINVAHRNIWQFLCAMKSVIISIQWWALWCALLHLRPKGNWTFGVNINPWINYFINSQCKCNAEVFMISNSIWKVIFSEAIYVHCINWYFVMPFNVCFKNSKCRCCCCCWENRQNVSPKEL